jgi:ketosteroid isomerase-like protein
MKILIAALLLCSAAPRPSTEPAAVEAVKAVAQEMGDAMMRADRQKLGEIYADDFAMVGSSGKVLRKPNVLAVHDKLEWFENGPMDVQVFGNIALSQGSVKETRSKSGTAEYAWMDLLERRNGKWVVKRSATAKLQSTDSSPDDLEAIHKQQQEMGPAMVSGDFEKVGEAFADDWAALSSCGALVDKSQMLEAFRTGRHKLISYEMAPLVIRVLGDVAMVQGAVHEQRMDGGKDTSGNLVFMDLVEKRGGRWVIVRSLGGRVE